MKNKRRLIIILSVIVLFIAILGSILIFGNDSSDVLENETDNLILTITEAGEYSNLYNYESIIIKTGDVTLKDVDVSKISIDENVDSGSIYLEDINVDEINIFGGINIYVYNSAINDFIINSNSSILNLDESTNVTNLEIYAIEEMITDSLINNLILNDSDNNSSIKVNENSAIENFDIKSLIDLTVYGGIELLNIYSVNDLEISIEENGYIKNLVTDVSTELNGSGTVYLVTTDTKDNITGSLEPLDYEIDEIEMLVSYIVTFDSNSGSSVSSQTIEENSVAKEPSEPTRSGYLFDGWKLDGELYNFSTQVTKDITLTAEWTKTTDESPVVTTYKVTFDSNGGSSVSSQTITENGTASKPSTPTRSGYTFVEWQYNGKTYSFSSKVTSNITLTAVWEKNVSTYKVTFDSNGGSSVSSQTITENGTASKPSTPTRSGYTFVEWQYNGKAYDFSTKITSNITLTAVWEEIITYTITISIINSDSYSPSRIMKVYANGVEISFSKITYTDGDSLCTGTNPYVSNIDVDGEIEFLVILTDGTTVLAKVD